uniref:PL48 domain-containing protein n=1 Tax=Rhabditophanes sp. KR3021 TaxID=114890 RepID=A0AC35TYW6_9BILA
MFAVSSGDKNNRDNICIQMEVANMMGRLQVEIKGIIGFARLANGDSFEITIKHGSQKIKSRGKTMTDKTQIWDINTLMIDCLPNHPLDVKVQEIKFFKSKVLSERSFDPSNFLTTTSQLVTMNLNSSGTIKLQFIITWIPLLSSKTRAAAQPMPCVNPTLIRSATQLSSNAFTSPLLTIKNSTSFSGTHTLNRHLTTKKNQQIVPDKLPKTRVILRDKKRNKSQHNDFGQKDQWRASTTLLDSAYNDLSKSIPTLDSLSALKELSRSRSNLDSGKGYVEENDVKEKRISKFFTTKLSAANKGKKNWARSLSMHQLTTPHSPPSPKAESVTLNGSQDESDTGLKHRTKNESYFNSTTSNSSGIGSEVSSHSELGLKTIDQLLGIIDTLRRKISDLRSAELVEINAFEAGMLSWESVLKFNRANLIEDRKCGKLSKSRGMPNGYAKRDTLYNALNSLKTNDSGHMPHLDNLDDNILLDSYNDSIVNKNDSGIYISKPSQMTSSIGRCYYGQVSPNTSDRVYQNASTLNGSCGPSQRRFKQFRERRKSIGLVFDQSSVSDSSSSSNMWSNGQDTHTPDYGFDFYKSATSNGQLDDCLKHHLNHALEGINRLTVILTKSPFEYKLNQLLLSLDNDTSALEEMMLINDNLPNIPNVSNMLSELGVDCEVQELWLGICYTLSSFLIVPRKEMTHKIHSFVYPIVTGRYPDLVDQVVTNFMALMCDETYWNSQFISLYQFISMVRGKPLKNYFENMAHEAWIKGTLKSNDPQLVNEIMFRLSNVPMLPPLESLRSIALVMLSENTDCTRPIVNYLVNSNGELSQDLTSCFLMLLEHDDHSTRRAACRVLSILRPPNVLKQLEYVMNNDPSDYVRKEAKYTLSSIGFNANEITNL